MSENTSALLEVVVPTAKYQDVEQGVSTHAPRRGIQGKTAVLLPSEKSSSPPFMHALAERMIAETHAKRVFVHNPEWPFFHPVRAAAIAPEIDELTRECDVMVSGVAY